MQTKVSNLGGIVSGGYGILSLNIDNCIVKNSEFLAETPNDTDVAGGIVGVFNGSNDITVKGCQFLNSTIEGSGGNTAGILGYAFANSNIEDCIVKDSQIISVRESQVGDCSTTGGVIGGMQKGQVINCDIMNSTINGRGTNIAGIVGVNTGNQTIEDCDVIDCIITDEDMTTLYYSMARGGITGTILGEGIYKNCTVKNTDMNVRASSIGGIAGSNGNKTSIEECIVDNVNIYAGKHATELTNNSSDISDTVAGIIGTISCYDKNINNSINTCTVKNTNIESVTDNIGGIIGNGGYSKYSDSQEFEW